MIIKKWIVSLVTNVNLEKGKKGEITESEYVFGYDSWLNQEIYFLLTISNNFYLSPVGTYANQKFQNVVKCSKRL